jgi:hypothetical protein
MERRNCPALDPAQERIRGGTTCKEELRVKEDRNEKK